MSNEKNIDIWIKWKLPALLVFILILICWLYRVTLLQTVQLFSDPQGNMSHGWLITVCSVYAIWRQRASLRSTEKHYSLTGILCMLLSLALLWLGNEHSLLWLQQISFISLIWSLIYALWGWKVARLTMFPVWYLTFTISIPSVLENLILKLQDISTTASYYLMSGCGFDIFQQGNDLLSSIEGSEFQFNIAGACSGIRSLLALTAFTALYAWYTQKTLIQKWLLFFCSFPVAILCNVIRVFSICLVAVTFGQETAVGYYHDYSGYVVVLLAIVLIFKLGSVISKIK